MITIKRTFHTASTLALGVESPDLAEEIVRYLESPDVQAAIAADLNMATMAVMDTWTESIKAMGWPAQGGQR